MVRTEGKVGARRTIKSAMGEGKKKPKLLRGAGISESREEDN